MSGDDTPSLHVSFGSVDRSDLESWADETPSEQLGSRFLRPGEACNLLPFGSNTMSRCSSEASVGTLVNGDSDIDPDFLIPPPVHDTDEAAAVAAAHASADEAPP